VAVLILHLGIVKTNLDPRHREGADVPEAVEAEEAARGLWGVLEERG
jgi:hypothetical protein